MWLFLGEGPPWLVRKDALKLPFVKVDSLKSKISALKLYWMKKWKSSYQKMQKSQKDIVNPDTWFGSPKN